MTPTDSRHALAALLAARVGLVAMACDDEQRAVSMVLAAAAGTRRPLFRWSVTDGLTRLDVPPEPRPWYDSDVVAVLRNIRDSRLAATYVLLDLHPYLTDPVVVRLLKDVATAPLPSRNTIVLVSPQVDVPDDLDHITLRFPVAFPDRAEREAIVDGVLAAEALAPCVVWVDEIEKGIATGGTEGDSGASRRLLGTFLTWLAEHRAPVFVVATANDITALPPELIRKGRFDEIFFLDLPDEPTRAQIVTIHARVHGLALAPDEAVALAAAAPQFSGAELEAAVVAATYGAYARGTVLAAADVLAEIRATRPLATVVDGRIGQLRAWAAPRTIPA